MAAAKSAGSRPSTRKPVRSCSTRVRRPPTAAATTGVPQAAASRATSPNDSERLGTRHDVGRPVVGSTAGGAGAGRTKRIWSATPRSATSVSMRSTSACALAAAGPADHDQRGVGPAKRGEGAHRDVEALERLDATDEEQHRTVAEREVGEGAPGPGPVAGREEGVVDAGRHDLDARRVGAVEPHELVGLGRAVGEDGVGAADDLGLGPTRRPGLGVAGLGLHPGEGVERRHQRQVELVLEPVPGDARQPVVGVEGVDVAEPSQVGRARRR